MLTNLYSDLMKLCDTNEAFYFVDHMHDGALYRVFTYRLASYTDFLNPGALECRGHTFRLDGDTAVLVSLPMQKFFNLGENPMTMDLDWSQVDRVEDKLDGSLISTVALPVNGSRNFILKSKTSLSSQQAKDASKLLESEAYWYFVQLLAGYVDMRCTVNMEYTAPDNQIVIGYNKPALRVLNIRHNETGEYIDMDTAGFPAMFVCEKDEFPHDNAEAYIEELRKMTGTEGRVITFKNGLKVKIKTDWYSNLHLQKEQVTNPRRLFESVIMEQSDDLKALFLADPLAVERIEDMEVKAKALYNRLHKLVDSFYHTNKELDRKSFAILGQTELKAEGVFSLAMNLYVGREMGLKEHLIKNFKSYGIEDNSVQVD